MKNHALAFLLLFAANSLANAADFHMSQDQQGSFEILSNMRTVEHCRPVSSDSTLKCRVGTAMLCQNIDGKVTRLFCQVPLPRQKKLPCGKGYPRRCS